MLAEAGGQRVALDRGHLVEHLERVVVHVEVVEDVLLHAAQRLELRQDLRGQPVRRHQREAGAGGRRADDLLELAEDALGRDPLQPGRLAPDRRRRLRLDRQLEVDGEPHGAQRAQRVVGQGAGAHHAQQPGREVGLAAVGVEQLPARERLGHGVDGEVARREIRADVVVVQADEVDVPGVTRPDDAPGAEGARQAEGRGADAAGQRAGAVRGVAGQRQVEVDRRPPEQPVTHGAADDPGLAVAEQRPRLVERRPHAATPSR